MSIQSEISRISGNVQDTLSAIASTGVTVPEGANSDDLPPLTQTLATTKQDKLTGQQGQVVGFDESGNAVAQDSPGLTQEQADERYLKLSGGTLTGDLEIDIIGTTDYVTVDFGWREDSMSSFAFPVLRGLEDPIFPDSAANKRYVDNLVGDIGSVLDAINGEVV